MTAVACKEVTFREFIGEWSSGRIIERDPTRPLAREGVRDRVLRRAYADHAPTRRVPQRGGTARIDSALYRAS
jgi:hypothetical protein